jgi:predicted helicase
VKEIEASNSWEQFRNALADLDTTRKGRIFEELTKLYLIANPIYSSALAQIWHNSEAPQSVIDRLGLSRPEIGVDLIAEARNGSFWIIQCKYHHDRQINVDYREVSTFLSITERDATYSKISHRLLATSANGISLKIPKNHPEKLGFITSAEFSSLGPLEFDSFREILREKPRLLIPCKPRPHQVEALKCCQNYFTNPANTRGKIIHPCGSGKSLLGYWISSQLGARRTLVLVPSLSLVRQTLSVWTKESQANSIPLKWIAVCSDQSVAEDEMCQAQDLGFEVTTSIDKIKSFYENASGQPNLAISTYHSAPLVNESIKQLGIEIDLVIYDEAHKTVGQKNRLFGRSLDNNSLPASKRVFMTATERVFSGSSGDILSMDDEDSYGRLIHYMSFKSAIEAVEPVLSDYKVITTIVTKREIRDIIETRCFIRADKGEWSIESDAQTIAALIALHKTVHKKGVRRIISFHNSIARAREFMHLNAQASKAGSGFMQLNSFHVSGRDSVGTRSEIFERFISANPSLITNARCLTEGVDIPSIDAVLFADPKQSKIDIVQAAGRAMRKSAEKEYGYVIIPIVVDEEASNQEASAFAQIITVISALGATDERIIDEFKAIVSQKQAPSRILEFDIPVCMEYVDINEFLTSLEILVWDRLSFAKSVVGESEFVKWMKQSTSLSAKSITNYAQAIRKISNDLVRLGIGYSSLEEIVDSDDLQALKAVYFNIAEYADLDRRGKSMYSAGFNKLIEYQASRKADS